MPLEPAHGRFDTCRPCATGPSDCLRHVREKQHRFERHWAATVSRALRPGTEQQRFDTAGDADNLARAIVVPMQSVLLPLRNSPPRTCAG